MHAKEHFKLRSAVHLILVRDGNVLMLRRFQIGWRDGDYSVVAGHLDGGETVTDAMVREAKEEACIDIAAQDLRVVHAMNRKGDDAEYVDFFLEADQWVGEIRIGEPSKCDDLSWFPLMQLPENTIPYIRSALNSIAKKETFSEFGW